MESSQSSLQSSEAGNTQLKQNLQELSANNEQLQAKLAEAKSHTIVAEEGLRNELTTQKKLNEVLRRSDAEKTAKLEQMKETLSEIQEQVQSKTVELEEELAVKDRTVDELESRVRTLEQEKSQLEERLQSVDHLMALQPRNGPASMSLSSTAAAVSRIQQSGQTFTEVVCCSRARL